MKNRLGKFRIRAEAIYSEPESLRGIMEQCVIVRAEQMYERHCFEYIAISNAFEEIPEGCMAPEYTWLCEDGEWIAERKGV